METFWGFQSFAEGGCNPEGGKIDIIFHYFRYEYRIHRELQGIPALSCDTKESRREGREESGKGQLISKANCQAVNSSKQRTNEFVFTTKQCVFVVFWRKLKTPIRHFENN